MTDAEEQTEATPSMDDLIRGRRADYQHAARERLFGPRDTSAPPEADDHDDNGNDAA
jgi:hypothetical protein